MPQPNFSDTSHITIPSQKAYEYLFDKANESALNAFEHILGIRLLKDQKSGNIGLHLKEGDTTTKEKLGSRISTALHVIDAVEQIVDTGFTEGLKVSDIRSWLQEPGHNLMPLLMKGVTAEMRMKVGDQQDRQKGKAKKAANKAAKANPSTATPSRNLSPEAAKLIKAIDLPHIAPTSENQGSYMQTIEDNDISFCLAPAGSGKTFLAVYKALQQLTEGHVSQIIMTSPAVTSGGEEHGFLPGDLDAKMDPYTQQIDHKFIKLLVGGDKRKGEELLKALKEARVIEIQPLAYMRGNEFEDAIVIADEAQNMKFSQMKTFLTRIVTGSKYIIVGDDEQTDLVPASLSALKPYAETFEGNLDGVGVARMDLSDCKNRHALIGPMLEVIESELTPDSGAPAQDGEGLAAIFSDANLRKLATSPEGLARLEELQIELARSGSKGPDHKPTHH